MDLHENEIMQHSDSDMLTLVLAPPVGEGFVWPSGTEKTMHGLSRPVYRLQMKKKRISSHKTIGWVLTITNWSFSLFFWLFGAVLILYGEIKSYIAYLGGW